MRRVLLAWLYSSVAAIVVTTIITRVGLAVGATTTTAAGQPVTAFIVPIYILVTIVVMLVGALFWSLISRKAKNPSLVLGILVTAVFLLSLLPLFSFGLGLTTFVTLLLVHIFTILIAVLVFGRVIKRA